MTLLASRDKLMLHGNDVAREGEPLPESFICMWTSRPTLVTRINYDYEFGVGGARKYQW